MKKPICLAIVLSLVFLMLPESSAAGKSRNVIFKPTDIFMYDLLDWSDMSLVERLDADVLGSPHAPDFQIDDPWGMERWKIKIENVHKAGLKYYEHLTMSKLDDIFRPDFKPACYDIDGNLLTDQVPPAGRPIYSLSNPIVKTELLNYMKKCIDVGIDGFANDCIAFPGYVAYQAGGDFSESSMASFRTYLSKKYTASQLAKFGINNITSFNYKSYIKNKYYKLYKSSTGNQRVANIPLFKDFVDCQYLVSVKFWNEVYSEIKAYAKSLDKDILISTNISECRQNGLISDFMPQLPIGDTGDFYMSEMSYDYPPNNIDLATYKLYGALGKQVIGLTNSYQETNELFYRKDLTTLMKSYISEAYASGDFMYVPYADELVGTLDNYKGRFFSCSNLDTLYPYYNFIKDNCSCFENNTGVSQIAILYSYSTLRYEYWEKADNSPSVQAFYGSAKILNDLHHQYDVLFSGDNVLAQDKFSLSDLEKYKVVILPNTRNMTKQQVSVILKYISSGGSVIAFGDVGRNDESAKSVSRKTFQSLLKEGKNAYGKGSLTYFKANIGADYLNSSVKNPASALLKAVGDKVKENVATNANKGVSIIEYNDSTSDTMKLHLLNYNYDVKKMEYIPQNNIQMKVRINPSLAGQKLGIYYTTPDSSSVQELKFTSDGNTVSFNIPKLNVYGVVCISTKGRISSMLQISRSEGLLNRIPGMPEEDEYRKLTEESEVYLSEASFTDADSLSRNTLDAIVKNASEFKAEESLQKLKEAVARWNTAGRTYNLANAKKALLKAEKLYAAGKYEDCTLEAEKASDLVKYNIDGKLADWEGIKPVSPEISYSNNQRITNIESIEIANDAEYLYILVKPKESDRKNKLQYELTVNDQKFYFNSGDESSREMHLLKGQGGAISSMIGIIAEKYDNADECRIPLTMIGSPSAVKLVITDASQNWETISTASVEFNITN